MRKFIKIISLSLFVSCPLWAQNNNQNSNFLKSIEYLNVVVDYSEATIAGLSYEEFSEMQNGNKSTQSMKSVELEWKMKLLSEANKNTNLFLGTYQNTPYTLCISFSYIDDNGNLSCICYFYNQDNQRIGPTQKFIVEGGRVGSVVNLIGDGHKHLGKDIGWYLSRIQPKN